MCWAAYIFRLDVPVTNVGIVHCGQPMNQFCHVYLQCGERRQQFPLDHVAQVTPRTKGQDQHQIRVRLVGVQQWDDVGGFHFNHCIALAPHELAVVPPEK